MLGESSIPFIAALFADHLQDQLVGDVMQAIKLRDVRLTAVPSSGKGGEGPRYGHKMNQSSGSSVMQKQVQSLEEVVKQVQECGNLGVVQCLALAKVAIPRHVDQQHVIKQITASNLSQAASIHSYALADTLTLQDFHDTYSQILV